MLSAHYAQCHLCRVVIYAECHYAECRYAECRGATQLPLQLTVQLL